MTQAQNRQRPGGEQIAASESTISKDDLYKTLANQRRRYAIHYLQYVGGPVKLGELAEQIGAWEQDTDPATLSANNRKSVYTALQQRHLPKMDDAAIVNFDKRAGIVKPTPQLQDFDIYTEVVKTSGFPWGQYYLGLSGVVLTLLSAVWADLYPFVLISDVGWSFFVAVAFSISALCHAFVTRQMKLGRNKTPPELEHV